MAKREPIYRHGYAIIEPEELRGAIESLKHGDEPDAYQTFRSQARGGVKAFENMFSSGGEQGDDGPDPIQWIRKFDPTNSSGAIPEGLDIMEKLQDATLKDDLMSSIMPLQSILGSSLYSAMKGGGSSAKSAAKVQKAKTEDIIAKLIAAAMANLSNEEREQAVVALNETEISKIRTAYYGNQTYTSNGETEPFKREINKLMPIFRKTYGVK